MCVCSVIYHEWTLDAHTRLQQHCPQVDRAGDDGHEPQGAPEHARVLQGQEVPPPRPPAKADTRHPPAHDEGASAYTYEMQYLLTFCLSTARVVIEDAEADEARAELPPAEVRAQGRVDALLALSVFCIEGSPLGGWEAVCRVSDRPL